MFMMIVGAGRVGSAWPSRRSPPAPMSVLDEIVSHERLDAGPHKSWEDAGGEFTVGTPLETTADRRPGSRAPMPSSSRPTATTRT